MTLQAREGIELLVTGSFRKGLDSIGPARWFDTPVVTIAGRDVLDRAAPTTRFGFFLETSFAEIARLKAGLASALI